MRQCAGGCLCLLRSHYGPVVSLHVPLTEKTHGFFDAECFAAMKDGSVFVKSVQRLARIPSSDMPSTARGAVADQNALIDALESGKVGQPGLLARS
jgi:phosphoglycerate dehydrogenase-like enzyme